MIKFTPIGAKVYVETDSKKFSCDKEEVDFDVIDSTHIVFSVGGGSSVPLSEITLDGETPTDLDDFLEKFSAVFPDAGGPAGPTPGIDDVLGEGQGLSDDRIININGHYLDIKNEAESLIRVNVLPGEERIRIASRSSETGSSAEFILESSTEHSWGFNLNASDGSNPSISIVGDSTPGTMVYTAVKQTFLGAIKLTDLPVFANNAAAISGGVQNGELYVSDVSGDLIVKQVSN